MISPPEIVDTLAAPLASIHCVMPRGEIMQQFPRAVAELESVLRAQGIAPAGPIHAHHLRLPTDTFDLAISYPTATPVVAAGRVYPATRPAQRVLTTTYQVPYQSLHAAWGEFAAWIKQSGHHCATDFWEVYLTDPSTHPDPQTWLTQLTRPLIP